MAARVLITGALHPDCISAFESNKLFDIHYHPDCSREQLLEQIKKAQVIITRSETQLDQAVIEAADELKVIARAAVGVGNIDINYATEKGILVLNCPGKNTNSAAELTIALLGGMLRNVSQAHNHMKSGGWDRHRFKGNELRGKKIGIVGLGNVGHRVAKFARGFDMEVYAYDPYIALKVFDRNGAERCESLEDLAAKVDILSVHTPLNKETKGLVDKVVLAKMAPGSYVVNAARGGIVHEQDLVAALNSGHIAGAAIDTFENEPKPLPELINHERVWVTPHIGASTEEAMRAIGNSVYQQVVKAIGGGVVDHPVNLPQIGVIDNPLLKTYAVLAEKLGSLAGQMISFNPSRVEVQYRGDLADIDHSLVRLGFMKGYASHVVDGYVSFVNADSHFERMGIKLEEKEEADFQAYRSALKVVVHGSDGKTLTIGGIVFDNTYPRLSLIKDFYFEIEPQGDFLIMENNDVPGVIGDVGHYLAKAGLNIDSFDLSRNRKGGTAMAVIKMDSPVAEDLSKGLAAIDNVNAAHAIQL